MLEWHGIDPVYISEHWSRELLNLMVEKLSERKKKEAGYDRPAPATNMISDKELFAKMGIKVNMAG